MGDFMRNLFGKINSWNPQTIRPSGPPDEKEWRAMPFLERVDRAARDIGGNGIWEPYVYLWHIGLWVFVVIGMNVAILLVVPRPEGMDDYHYYLQCYIKSMIWHHIAEGSGWAKQGKLWGGRDWPDTWKYALTPGTMKQPLFYIFGCKRNIVDCAVWALFFINGLVAMFTITLPVEMLYVIVFCNVYFVLCDFHQWMQCVGYTWGYLLIAAAFPEGHGQLAGMQIVMIIQRIGCGMGKKGPWFTNVLGQFAQNNPLWRHSEWYPAIMHKGPDDFAPSPFITVISYCAAVYETFVPCLMFFTPWPVAVYAGVIGLVCMHTYIIMAPCFIDVVGWNIGFIISDVYLFVIARCGFDYAGLWNMFLTWDGYLLFGLLAVDMFTATIMNLFPMYLNRYFRHAHFAGNWVQAWFMVKKSAEDKLLSDTKWYGNVAWAYAKDGIAGEYATYKGMAYSWMCNLNAKVIPVLIRTSVSMAGGAPEDYYFVPGHPFMEFFGGAGCDGQQGGPFITSTLAKCCNLESGDVRCIQVFPFPSPHFPGTGFGREVPWHIVDAKDGIVLEGKVTMDELFNVSNLPTASEKLAPLCIDTAEDTIVGA